MKSIVNPNKGTLTPEGVALCDEFIELVLPFINRTVVDKGVNPFELGAALESHLRYRISLATLEWQQCQINELYKE